MVSLPNSSIIKATKSVKHAIPSCAPEVSYYISACELISWFEMPVSSNNAIPNHILKDISSTGDWKQMSHLNRTTVISSSCSSAIGI